MTTTEHETRFATESPRFDLGWMVDEAPAQYRYAVDAIRNLSAIMANGLDGLVIPEQLVALMAAATFDAPECPSCGATPNQQLPVAGLQDGKVARNDFRCARCAYEHPVWWTD